MEKMPEFELKHDVAVGHTMFDKRNNSYFVVSSVKPDGLYVLGYRYTNEDNLNRDRCKEADIVSLSELVLHYKKLD